MAFSASLYEFKQALQSSGVLATVNDAITGDVEDPVRIEWDSPEYTVVIGDDLSNFVQDLLLYTATQMQDLFLLAQSLTPATDEIYKATLFGFKMALRQQGHLTTIHQAIPADVTDVSNVEWTSIDSLVVIDDPLSLLVQATLGYTDVQMQELFLLARGYMGLPLPQPGTIVDYDSLVLAIADWLAREDLMPRIPVFIQMFENWWAREARIEDHYTEATFTPGVDGMIDLPSDFAALDSVTLISGGASWPLSPVTKNYASGLGSGGVPTHFRIIGRKLKPVPTGTGTIEVGYYAKLTRLTPSNQTNWLISAWPEAYLWGSLLQASTFIHDLEGVSFWGQALAGVRDSITSMDNSRWVGAQMRPLGVCP